jgi:hypothetical protein
MVLINSGKKPLSFRLLQFLKKSSTKLILLFILVPLLGAVIFFTVFKEKKSPEDSLVSERPAVKGKVHIDIVPPAPSVDYPQPGDNVSPDFVFSGKGSEEGAIITVIDMNNTAQGALCKANVKQPPSYKWECKSNIELLRGIYRVKITETDTYGKEGDPTIVEFTRL